MSQSEEGVTCLSRPEEEEGGVSQPKEGLLLLAAVDSLYFMH